MIETEENIKAKVVDEKFIEQLCKNTWETTYRYVYFKVQNQEEAEDITQETYYKAISYLQKNNLNIDTFIGFLKTVSLNVIRDKWRKNKRRVITVNIDDIRQDETAISDCTEDLARRDIVENALRLLNEEQRTVVELRILKGYSVADTAKEMNKKQSSVRVLQHRALQNLTKILKEEY